MFPVYILATLAFSSAQAFSAKGQFRYFHLWLQLVFRYIYCSVF
jgi:hypothetical protein